MCCCRVSNMFPPPPPTVIMSFCLVTYKRESAPMVHLQVPTLWMGLFATENVTCVSEEADWGNMNAHSWPAHRRNVINTRRNQNSHLFPSGSRDRFHIIHCCTGLDWAGKQWWWCGDRRGVRRKPGRRRRKVVAGASFRNSEGAEQV